MTSENHDQTADRESTLLNLWIQYSAGISLSPAEIVSLRHALSVNPQFRAIAMQDERVDTLLKSLDSMTRTEPFDTQEDHFLDTVLRRCSQTPLPGDTSLPGHSSQLDGVSLPYDPSLSSDLPPGQSGPADLRPYRGTRRPGGRRFDWGRSIVFAVILSVAVVSTGWWFLRDQFQREKLDGGGTVLVDPDQKLEPERATPEWYARIVNPDSAILRGVRDPERVLAEQLILEQGSIRLEFAGGAVVDVFGPARFQLMSSGEVKLDEGELSANVPSPARGFRVTTPTAVIVDLGTVFDVAVGVGGVTEAEVRQGVISAEAVDEQGRLKWQLSADDLNQVMFYERLEDWSDGPSSAVKLSAPIASAARGFGNEFSGLISFTGRTMKFSDEETFEAARNKINMSFSASPQEAVRDWINFVDQQAGESDVRGDVLH